MYTALAKKTSARLRELAPSSVASSRNLADVFLDIPVQVAHLTQNQNFDDTG